MLLESKVAIVTGAGSGGSGRAIARRFAREGAFVIVSDIDEPGTRETVRLIEIDGGRAAAFRADVGIESDVSDLVAFAEKKGGGLDVLVNNAGPYFPQARLDRWFETVQANLLGTMYGISYGIEAMRRRGGGAIVNVGSTSALGHGRKHSKSPAYDAAKAAVVRLTTTLGWLAGDENIRVSCIVPDWVATDEVAAYVAGLSPEQRKRDGVPEPLTTLDEIAGAVLDLATNEALAGRVLVWWSGQRPRLIPVGDPGYAALE